MSLGMFSYMYSYCCPQNCFHFWKCLNSNKKLANALTQAWHNFSCATLQMQSSSTVDQQLCHIGASQYSSWPSHTCSLPNGSRVAMLLLKHRLSSWAGYRAGHFACIPVCDSQYTLFAHIDSHRRVAGSFWSTFCEGRELDHIPLAGQKKTF